MKTKARMWQTNNEWEQKAIRFSHWMSARQTGRDIYWIMSCVRLWKSRCGKPYPRREISRRIIHRNENKFGFLWLLSLRLRFQIKMLATEIDAVWLIYSALWSVDIMIHPCATDVFIIFSVNSSSEQRFSVSGLNHWSRRPFRLTASLYCNQESALVMIDWVFC